MKQFLGVLAFAFALAVSPLATAQSLDQAKIAEVTKAKGTLLARGKDAYRTGQPP